MAERRHIDRAERFRRRSQLVGQPYCPAGVPRGIHPKLMTKLGGQRFGINSRGAKTLLSDDTHSTIINGESRTFLYPDQYPLTAGSCKLYVSYRPSAGAAWKSATEATGYLIGKSTMMTSGHVQPPSTDNGWMIKVVPACWAGAIHFQPELSHLRKRNVVVELRRRQRHPSLSFVRRHWRADRILWLPRL